jgi:hypothetical protein
LTRKLNVFVRFFLVRRLQLFHAEIDKLKDGRIACSCMRPRIARQCLISVVGQWL